MNPSAAMIKGNYIKVLTPVSYPVPSGYVGIEDMATRLSGLRFTSCDFPDMLARLSNSLWRQKGEKSTRVKESEREWQSER